MLFDDMLSEAEENNDDLGSDDGQWEHWQEALDPSNNVVLRPAADSAIAALPRKEYSQVKEVQRRGVCMICRDEFVISCSASSFETQLLICCLGLRMTLWW